MIHGPAACHPKTQPPLISTYDSWGQIVQWHRFTNSDYGPNGGGVFGGFSSFAKKGQFFLKEEDHFSTERCAIKKYDEICTYCHYIKHTSCSINTSLSL